MTPVELLADLVAFPSLPGTPNGEIVAYIAKHLADHGVEARILPGPEGDRANLFATFGPSDQPGVALSGHMDVVPASGQPWTSDPFRLTEDGDRLVGRGAVDMKGFLACVLAMAPAWRALPLRRPLHLAFSYDEEIGCRGVGHLIERLGELCAPPLGCIVGEATDMRPVLSHKSKQATEVTFHGRAAHSSNPALGRNALYPAAEFVLFLRDLADRLARQGPFDLRFDPPCATLSAGVVKGGTAVNIVPDACVVRFEVRAPPEMSTQAITREALDFARALEAETASVRELSAYPALPSPIDPTFPALIERLSAKSALASVSYGTEAGLFAAAGVPSVICGPGSIERAHRADEFVLRHELQDCAAMLARLGDFACQ